MHDFCRAGGLLLHAVPFTVHLEHGFYNYQPNFFTALATYNGYATEGMWVGPDWQLASLVPWEPEVLDYLTLNAKTTHLLVVLHRKRYDTPFCVPFQAVYEPMTPKDALARYATIVDGDLLDPGAPRPARPGTASPLRAVPGRDLLGARIRGARYQYTPGGAGLVDQKPRVVHPPEWYSKPVPSDAEGRQAKHNGGSL